MTVQELIEELKQYPSDATVVAFEGSVQGWEAPGVWWIESERTVYL